MILISPSLLSSSLVDLRSEMEKIKDFGADFAHIDCMDGNFVPNIAFGPSFVSALRKVSDLPLDVHLMINNPVKYIDKFIEAGSDYITIHIETINNDEFEIIEKKVHFAGKKLGITLRPSTPIKHIIKYLNKVDLVLVMSVEPGFSGQKFMPIGLEYLSFLKKYRKDNNLNYLIEIDGGVDNTNFAKCIASGADILVSGSYLFASNMKEKIMEMKSYNE